MLYSLGAVFCQADHGRGFDGDSGPNHRLVRGGHGHRNRNATGQDSGASNIVEVASGMNYWDGHQWSPSEAKFIPQADGSFTANKIHHQILLKANLNRINAVTMTLPDGTVLQSTPIGIRLYDTASGDALVIGTLRDSSPVQVSDNQIIYSDAFSGACASIIYTLDRGSFQQDVVLTSNLDPQRWGFPTNTTRIQIITEFYDGHQPDALTHPLYVEADDVVRSQRATPDFIDQTLDFGEMVFGLGRAYTAVTDTGIAPVEAVVGKEFINQDNRTLLIESVEYVSIKAGLDLLGPCGEHASLPVKRGKANLMAAFPLRPSSEAGYAVRSSAGSATTFAKLAAPKGVTVDYIASASGTAVFRGDTTYFVSGPVNLTGPATIEGGAVFKYPNSTGTGAVTAYLQTSSTLTLKTTPYRPAFFTAADDDTVGDKFSTATWSGYTGAISGRSYANPAVWMTYPSAPTLSNCRFRYAQAGVRLQGPGGYVSGTISHSQFVSCVRGIELQGTGSGSGSSSGTGVSVALNNCLMSTVTYPVQPTICGTSYGATFNNCTVDTATSVANGSTSSISVLAYNSIFANIYSVGTGVGAGGNHNGFYGNLSPFGTSSIVSASNPFKSVGGGNYYLPVSSSFRNTGSATNIPSALLSDLRFRTTDPPWQVPSGATLPSQIGPQALRDADSVDCGYHYDILDYLFQQVAVANSGVPTVLTNGVAVGLLGSYGISIPENGTLIGEGQPLSMNRLVWFNAVQEQPSVPSVSTPTTAGIFDVSGATSTSTSIAKPSIQLRFTDLPMIGHLQNFFNGSASPRNLGTLGVRDCWLRGVALAITSNSVNYQPTAIPAFGLTNNLIERGQISLYNGFGSSINSQLTANLYNNLFWQATNALALIYNDAGAVTHPSWVIRDNLFDNDTTSLTGTGSYSNYVISSYNAFFNTSSTPLTGTGNTNLTALTYAVGTPTALAWYIGSSTPSLKDLDTARTADVAGLYHYTLFTSQVKETNGPTDIGFHYVALGNNIPADSDGDGIPDYLEDRNGNGAVDSGEFNWTISNSGLNSISPLTIYTPLH